VSLARGAGEYALRLVAGAGAAGTASPSKVVLILIAACIGAAPAAAQDVRVEASRDGEFVNVAAFAEFPADLRVAWEVLSDYNRLAQFIPDISSSRVVSRDGGRVMVEQKGTIGFFFYRQPVEVRLAVLEEPMRRITARAVSGNIRDLETRYELQPGGAGLKLVYSGRFIPEFTVPPLIGLPIMRHIIERRFRAMVNEILRRDALAKGARRQ
jgi:carbon monoxide dehydrogenase subunit G